MRKIPKTNQPEQQLELVDPTRKVQVYRNLHKKCWSVRQRGIVRFHCDVMQLRDCHYIVNDKGRQKVLQEKKKNVHAYITGYVCARREVLHAENEFLSDPDDYCDYSVAYYNPYLCESFVDRDTRIPISKSDYCDLDITQPSKVLAIWLQHTPVG